MTESLGGQDRLREMHLVRTEKMPLFRGFFFAVDKLYL